ncbi:MAG: Npun_F0813 family protein [Cyanobacteria bacterium P01_D01_bin.50]
MFILKRQDVEISSIVHPKRDQQVPVLNYQGQTFRLISAFKANQEEEARALWRELTDNRGKACVLLEEEDRFSVWGKIRLDQLGYEATNQGKNKIVTVASILLLQTVYMDIEEFLGAKQANLFKKEISHILNRWQFPAASSPQAIDYLLSINPIEPIQIPFWEEDYAIVFLEELHRLGKAYFGSSDFAHQVMDTLQDMPMAERTLFINWLKNSPLNKLWH